MNYRGQLGNAFPLGWVSHRRDRNEVVGVPPERRGSPLLEGGDGGLRSLFPKG